MKLSRTYIEAAEDVIVRNERHLRRGGGNFVFTILNSFLCNYKEILNIGSGGYMPILVPTTVALDVSSVAEKILRKHGWEGKFVVGSCTDLPFDDREFECGVCAEVFEHLPNHEDVVRSFQEIERVCRSWIVSVPVSLGTEPDHKRVITPQDMKYFCGAHEAEFHQVKMWYFIWKGEHAPRFPVSSGVCGVPRGATHD